MASGMSSHTIAFQPLRAGTSVAAFGAFVDIGVHQDGLVHISAMSKTFVKDPRAVVKPGDIVRVKVLEVDKPRKAEGGSRGAKRSAEPVREQSGGALADALRRAGLGEKRK